MADIIKLPEFNLWETVCIRNLSNFRKIQKYIKNILSTPQHTPHSFSAPLKFLKWVRVVTWIFTGEVLGLDNPSLKFTEIVRQIKSHLFWK